MARGNSFICCHCFNRHKITDCIWSVPAKSRYGIILCPFCEKMNHIPIKVIIEAVTK